MATLGAVVALTSSCVPHARADLEILRAGHVDLVAIYEGGNLAWRFNADGATSEAGTNLEGLISPSELFVRVPDLVNINRAPPGSNSNLTGYSGSGAFFFFPSSGISGAPFLGWAHDTGGRPGEIDLSQWNTNNVLVELVAASMPIGGEFSLWVSSTNFVSTFNPSLTNAGPSPNSFNLPSHNHFNWGFTAEGIYDITLRVSGTHNTDGFRSSDATFRFLVGDTTAVPEPTSFGLLIVGVASTCFLRRRRKPAVV